MRSTLKHAFHPTAYPHQEPWEQEWAAVGVVFREHNELLELLFIERAHNPLDAWSGHMSFPGGRREHQEEVHETAISECFEEVGLDLTQGADLLGFLPPIQAYKQGRAQNFSIIPVGFYLTKNQQLLLQPSEVGHAEWIGLNWLLDHVNHSSFCYSQGEQEIMLPCIPLKNNKIWGLTYKVIDLLQSRMP